MSLIPVLWKAEAGGSPSSRTARAIQCNYASKNKRQNNKNLKEFMKMDFKDHIIYFVFNMLDW